MRPESFHLAIGMQRYDALKALAAWNPKGGATNDQIVVDYEGDKALTLEFRKDRLQSIRFELFPYLPETRKVFEEEKTYLRQALGPPRKATSSILIYDAVLPNVMVVVSDSATSAQGKKGLGVLAVRYYDPR
jgi:hypothetical protein